MTNFSQINVLDILSQKPPAVYVDRILSYDSVSKTLIAEKYISSGEHLLKGHFDGNPVVPAIFTIEALSQACFLCGYAVTRSVHDYLDKGVYEHLAISINVKFKNKAIAEDTLLLQAKFKDYVNAVSIYGVKAIMKSNGRIVATGEIMGLARIIDGEAENHAE